MVAVVSVVGAVDEGNSPEEDPGIIVDLARRREVSRDTEGQETPLSLRLVNLP